MRKKGRDISMARFEDVMAIFENIDNGRPAGFHGDLTITQSNVIDVYNESCMFSKNDLYINFDKFTSGKSNICFITGLSGSGKTTLAKTIAREQNAEYIELDIFENPSAFNDDELIQAGQVFYDYFSTHKSLWENMKKKNLHGKQLADESSKFLNYCISWCKRHTESKWIIEGIQVYEYANRGIIKNYPIVIVNASIIKAIIQRWKRNGNGKIKLLDELRNEFPQLVSWYFEQDRILKKFIDGITESVDDMIPDDDAISFLEASGNSTIIRDAIYPIVESVLSTPAGDRKFRQLVQKFIDRNS